MSSNIDRIRQLSHQFQTELSTTVNETLGREDALTNFLLRATETRVSLTTNRPIELFIDGEHQLNLLITYWLSLSSDSQFLAVDTSSFKVLTLEENDQFGPIVTFDYMRQPRSSDVPTSHLNLHTQNDSTLRALALSGSSRRAKNRRRKAAKSFDKGRSVRSPHGAEGDIHIPLGGARFRPCLEDVLEMLIVEFGVDHNKNSWKRTLSEGRKRWRKHQLLAAVKDNPTTAAERLRELGYDVAWNGPGEEPKTRVEKLERF